MEPFKENIITHNLTFPVDIFLYNHERKFIVAEPHWHDCIEILYILKGTVEQQINDKYYLLHGNDIIILNVGDIHGTYRISDDDVEILVIKFMPDVIENGVSRIYESKYIRAFLNNHNNRSVRIIRDLKNASDIHKLMLGLYEEFIAKDSGYEIFIKGYIYQLIANLIRNGIYTPLYKENELLSLDKLFEYIESHYNQKIKLEEAAKIYNLSYSYFSRYFKKVTGRTFKDYVDFVRISEVERLILSKTMNISEAAYEVGFCNISSFNRVFKRVRGYTPGEIKKSKTAKE